jgi:hypothetical protein
MAQPTAAMDTDDEEEAATAQAAHQQAQAAAAAAEAEAVRQRLARLLQRLFRRVDPATWNRRAALERGNQIIKLRASPAKATMELPFAQNYAASTSELLLSPHRLTAVY